MPTWAQDAIFYHIYPLGLCGAPACNDFHSDPVPRLLKIEGWIPHLLSLGVNALYLGPLFESSSHGYDTADYFRVDRRLGDTAALARLSASLHQQGVRLVLDGVFNHVGRDFWAFKDVLANGPRSPYAGWFAQLDFSSRSPYGDPFSYQGWNGHYSLVKLNLSNAEVREHLFSAVSQWVSEYDIDGLRLDAADVIDHDFLRALAAHCRRLKADFFLLGEVVHGDYRQWANPAELDSVTNYEVYKGLYSSLNDRNYFEIAYSLKRQFASGGLYADLPLYNFADNHDVNRVASLLHNPAHLYPLYALLFSMPGVPSLYYGSEFGLPGVKDRGDHALRPAIELPDLAARPMQPGLLPAIQRLAGTRQRLPALRRGTYRELLVDHTSLVFLRQRHEQSVLVALNAASQPRELSLRLPDISATSFLDVLNDDQSFSLLDGELRLTVPPAWARILVSSA